MARFRTTLIVLGLLALTATPVSASDPLDSPKGGKGRELLDPVIASGPARQEITDDFEVVGHANLGGGVPNGDVFVYDHGGSVGTYAYVGTWSAQCTGQGAKVIDVNDPSHPKWVGFVGARKDSSNEDVVVVRIGDRDVLGIGVQACGPRGSAGLALFDVTDPRDPFELSFFPTASGGVHELDLVVRDDVALALLAVPFAEFTFDDQGNQTPVGEFQIVDITDPETPNLLTEWRLFDQGLTMHGGAHEITSIFQGEGLFPVMFDHSARAADGGDTAYVSYWDAGVVKVDISDPSAPVTIGHTVYPVASDGEAHSMTPFDVAGTRYILQNDEDFEPFNTTAEATSSATGTRKFVAIEEPFWSPTLLADTGPISGMVHDAADGCQATDYAGAEGDIVIADSVDPFYNPAPCAIGDQAVLAAEAGAIAFVSNLVSIDDAYGYGPDTEADLSVLAGMPVLQISDIDGLADAIRGAGTATLSLDPSTPGWGFLRVFQETGNTNWEEVGRFEGPAVNGTIDFPPGDWSIHNTEVLGDHAYSSWYSAGIIALDLGDPTSPQMVGQFVPKTSKKGANSLGPGPALVWGVAIDPDSGLIYASDMRTGLWIVRPVGDAAP
jgi:hypothetical protein